MATDPLRQQLISLLDGGNAHVKFDQVIKDFPPALRGKKARNLPYTAWQFLEHMRLAQADILDFSVNPEYKERAWPADYWPKSPAPADDAAWNKSLRSFRADLRRMKELVETGDLFTPFAWGDGQNLLREALVLADHNAYHLGQMVLLRRLLGAWKE